MMKKLILLTSFALITGTSALFAQENHLNFGVGASGWGIPIYASYDFNIAEDWNLFGGMSYQSKSESYNYPGYSFKENNSIIAFRAGAQFYFDRLINLDEDFDVYGIGVLSYYIWNQSYEGPGLPPGYSGSGDGGFGIGLGAGGRWHFNEKWSLNLEIGGGTVMSGMLIGVSMKM
jgi:outer membrane immunogenic protein